MTVKELEDVFDGCALMEYMGELYVTTGMKDVEGRYVFEAVNAGEQARLNWETLLSKSCKVQY